MNIQKRNYKTRKEKGALKKVNKGIIIIKIRNSNIQLFIRQLEIQRKDFTIYSYSFINRGIISFWERNIIWFKEAKIV